MKTVRQSAGNNRRSRTRADEIYHQLRTAILELNLRPGDQLDEDGLATTYGVSRTPVREALRRLSFDGLVTLRPHRGAHVSEISLRDIWEIEQICELAEPLAARLAAGRLPQHVIEGLKRAFDEAEVENPQPSDFIYYMKLDITLHDTILEAAGNEIMREIVTHLHRRMNAVRLISNAHTYTQSLAEHRKILEALERADGDAAYEAMKVHIRNRVTRQRNGLMHADLSQLIHS